MNAFKIIFGSFFVSAEAKNYVEKGKGTGATLVALSSFFLALIFSFFFLIKPVFLSSDIEKSIHEGFDRLPRIVITNGELEWEDNVKQNFVLGNGIYMTVDTINPYPSVQEIRKSLIYLTKTHAYIHNPQNNETKDIAFSELNKMFGMNSIELSSENTKNFIIRFVKIVIVTMVVLILIFMTLFYLILGSIASGISRAIACTILKNSKKISKDTDTGLFFYRRMATMALLPSFIVLDLLQTFAGFPSSSLIKWILIIAITVGIYCLNFGKFQEIKVEPVGTLPEENKL